MIGLKSTEEQRASAHIKNKNGLPSDKDEIADISQPVVEEERDQHECAG